TGITETKQNYAIEIAYELIGIDATGTDHEGKPLEPRPSCMFQRYKLIPSSSRGNFLDIIKMVDPSVTKQPNDPDWLRDNLLGQPVNLSVDVWTSKDGSKSGNNFTVSPIPSKYRSGVGAPRTDLVYFEPYTDNDENNQAYQKLYPYQRAALLEALDKDVIPFAGREVTKASDTEQNAGRSTVETTDREPESTEYDPDCPF
ncbi:UNVERIFIED_CONTAM: hypothetical protein RF648_20945, partial [Kocuria sp. CPCC 205274]